MTPEDEEPKAIHAAVRAHGAAFIAGGPLLSGTALELHPELEWPFIRARVEASVSEGRRQPGSSSMRPAGTRGTDCE